MTSQLDFCLAVGAVLFVLGAVGFLTRRNLILIMLSAELMLHGVSLNLVAFSAHHETFRGQSFVIFLLAIAACEAGISLALILGLYRRRKTLDVDVWSGLRETPPDPAPSPRDAASIVVEEEEMEFPRLTPAGRTPSPRTSLSPDAAAEETARA